MSSSWVARLRLRWDVAPAASLRAVAPRVAVRPQRSPRLHHRQCPYKNIARVLAVVSIQLSFTSLLFEIWGLLELSPFSFSFKFVPGLLHLSFPVAWSPAFSSLLLSLSLSSPDFYSHSLLSFTTLTPSRGRAGRLHILLLL